MANKYLYICDWPSGSAVNTNLKKLVKEVYVRFHYLIEFHPEFLNDPERQILHNTRLNNIMDTKYAATIGFKGNNLSYRLFVHPVSQITHINMRDFYFTVKRMRL